MHGNYVPRAALACSQARLLDIRSMRVTASMIVGQIGAGVSIEELLSDYPYLEREDSMQA